MSGTGSVVATAALARTFVRSNLPEASRVVEGLRTEEAAGLLERLPRGEALRMVEEILAPTAVQILERMDPSGAAALLDAADPQRAAELLARMDDPLRERLLALLSPAAAREVRLLMSYPDDSAGSLMDPRAPVFREGTRAREVLSRLRGSQVKRVDDVFVLDEEQRLVGVVALQDIAISKPGGEIAALVRQSPAHVHALAPRSEVLALFEKMKVASLPVVDSDRKLLGFIPNETLVTASAEEATADIQTMVGVSAEERVKSTPGFAIRKRLPWLMINLGTAFLAAFVVGVFEKTIAQVTALAVLLPVVAGQSGNTGAQTLAILMRGLALREIRPSQWARATGKELLVALSNGAVIGAVAAAGVYLWSGSVGLSAVIAVAMVFSMVCAAASGVAIPLGLAAFGQDPAQASSILLTTVTDVVGFTSFLGLATLLLGVL